MRNYELAKQEAQRICKQLTSWGVDANIMDPIAASKVNTMWIGETIVKIADNPINLIHVSYLHEYRDEIMSDHYTYDFIVPDSRRLPNLDISATPVRKGIWRLGQLIDLRWKGKDNGMPISEDQEVKAAIISLVADKDKPKFDDTSNIIMKIHSRSSNSWWEIIPEDYFILTPAGWHALESIAKRLLVIDIPKLASSG